MQSVPGREPALQRRALDDTRSGEAAEAVSEGAGAEGEAQPEVELEVEVIEASAAETVTLPAAFAIEEVPPGAMAVARRLADETGHALLRDVVSGRGTADFQAFNNALMDLYRVHGSVEAFTLLFELNTRPFSMIAARIMRMTSCRAELGDILQETFLAIYRYPTRFCPDKPNAFRNWSYSIIRNTVYRHLQISAREGIPVDLLAEVLADEHASSPVTETENAESDARCQRVYELVLCLYADIYERDLKPRDRLALRLVEIDQLGYREAAEALGVRLENFKMIVCRARKKIFQSLVRTLGTRPS
jgi:RNA polymerase sigma factor (sigma-70 family)